MLEVGTSLHELVEARLHDTPQEVRSLITLSSLQGVRLLYLVSERLIARLQARGYDLANVTFIGHSHLTRVFALTEDEALEVVARKFTLKDDMKYIITVGSVSLRFEAS